MAVKEVSTSFALSSILLEALLLLLDVVLDLASVDESTLFPELPPLSVSSLVGDMESVASRSAAITEKKKR